MTLRLGAWLALAAGLALGTTVLSVERELAGKKLVIKNTAGGNKIIYISRDAGNIDLPAVPIEDPRCAPDGTGLASLTVSSTTTGESFTIDLGGINCSNWTVNGAGNLYKYRDRTRTTCNVVVIKDGRLAKLRCKGSQVDYSLGADQGSVDVVLETGPDRRYCTTFNDGAQGCTVRRDGSDGRTYLAKGCTASGPCPSSPSGAFVDASELPF